MSDGEGRPGGGNSSTETLVRSLAPTLRQLAPSVFLPALVYEIGNGAIAPVIAITATTLGAAPTTAGLMLALMGIGRVIGDIPASWLAEKVGDRHSMILAAGLDIAALLLCYFAGSLALFGGGLLIVGMSSATFYLARQSYMTEVVPIRHRARAMSTLAGSHRVGLFIGPFLGAAVIDLTSLRSAYLVAVCTATIAAVLLLVIPDAPIPQGQAPSIRGGISSRQILVNNRRLFATLGLAIFATSGVRAARQTVLPLWAQHLGLSPAHTSVIFGIASAVDMALFYPAGKIMDHFGRLSVALPSMAILGGAMAALPLTTSALSVTIVAMIMSFGNGIGAGIMLTIGADAAPIAGRLRFLGIWRILGDTGNAAGPVIMSVVAIGTSLSLGIVAVGGLGLCAVAALAAWVPKYAPGPSRAKP